MVQCVHAKSSHLFYGRHGGRTSKALIILINVNLYSALYKKPREDDRDRSTWHRRVSCKPFGESGHVNEERVSKFTILHCINSSVNPYLRLYAAEIPPYDCSVAAVDAHAAAIPSRSFSPPGSVTVSLSRTTCHVECSMAPHLLKE